MYIMCLYLVLFAYILLMPSHYPYITGVMSISLILRPCIGCCAHLYSVGFYFALHALISLLYLVIYCCCTVYKDIFN